MSLSPTRQRACLAIMERLLSHRIASMFSQPVDPERDGCPTYPQVVKHPMDLGTVVEKVKSGGYKSVGEWRSDVDLVWENAFAFNGRQSLVSTLARQLQTVFREMTEFVTDNEKNDWVNKLSELRSRVGAIRAQAPKHLQPPKPPKKEHEADPAKGKVTRTASQSSTKKEKTKERETKTLQRSMSARAPPKTFTQDEIVRLTEDVNSLGEDMMEPIIDLIRKYEPQLMQEGEEVEIEVSKLKIDTLLGLRTLVDRLTRK